MDQSVANADDIRWQQRLQNYLRALDRLKNAVDLSQARPLLPLLLAFGEKMRDIQHASGA